MWFEDQNNRASLQCLVKLTVQHKSDKKVAWISRKRRDSGFKLLLGWKTAIKIPEYHGSKLFCVVLQLWNFRLPTHRHSLGLLLKFTSLYVLKFTQYVLGTRTLNMILLIAVVVACLFFALKAQRVWTLSGLETEMSSRNLTMDTDPLSWGFH